MVLRALARATTRTDDRDVLRDLAKVAEANLAGLASEATLTKASVSARHRLMARAAGRAYVPVLIAFEAEQSRAAEHASAALPPALATALQVRAEVLRGLAATSRQRHSGNFRAAVFGANDGLVSNLALVVGMSATGVSAAVVLAAGLAGLLAGALSMAAGEYISVRSARELLEASALDPSRTQRLINSGVDADGVALVYRARGMSAAQAASSAIAASGRGERVSTDAPTAAEQSAQDHAMGQAWGAAIASFCFFASGALIPILPYLLGFSATASMLAAIVLVGLALLATGATVGLLSGASAARRAVRQLAIGYGAAAVTYLLGLAFGAAGVG